MSCHDRILRSLCSFEGMFRDGQRNGRGKYQLIDGRVEIYRYVNDNRVGSGVRWSKNRDKAWLMNGGKAIRKVTLTEAIAIAKTCGPIVQESMPMMTKETPDER